MTRSILLVLFLASIAVAQQDDPRLQKFLQQYPAADLNGDGTLTLQEARQYRQARRRNEQAGDRSAKPATTMKRYSVDELTSVYEAREFKGLLYRFLAPQVDEGKRYPLILSLHGAGGKGDDNLKNLKPWNGVIAEPAFQERHPCFVVVPQSPEAWRVAGSVPDVGPQQISGYSETWQKVAKGRRMFVSPAPNGKLGLVFELLDRLASELPIDTDRVYVLGHSMGGFGTFEALAMQPQRFAAAIPSAGGLSPWHDPAVFKQVAVWAFHGDLDEAVPMQLTQEVFQRMKSVGGNMKFTRLGGVGHGSNAYAFVYTGDNMHANFKTTLSGPACDTTEDVWQWLFAQKRP